MTSHDADPFGFEAIYAGRSALGARPPWDIGAAQPVLADALADGRLVGEVLDVGCGTGEHALLCAAAGHLCTGVDISASALDVARAKAAERGLAVEWITGDAVRLPGLQNRFDTVVDCGFLDSCPAELRPTYAAALHRACRPGATILLLELDAAAAAEVRKGFAACGIAAAPLARMPELTAGDLRRTFADGWRVESVEPSSMLVRSGPERTARLSAWFAQVRRL
jgi:2-polyprenyl-3-methyl-5-hydroxy-6-metoxy-1,4-benzoquinol methylase